MAENKNLKIIFTKLFDRLCRMFGKIHFFYKYPANIYLFKVKNRNTKNVAKNVQS